MFPHRGTVGAQSAGVSPARGRGRVGVDVRRHGQIVESPAVHPAVRRRAVAAGRRRMRRSCLRPVPTAIGEDPHQGAERTRLGGVDDRCPGPVPGGRRPHATSIARVEEDAPRSTRPVTDETLGGTPPTTSTHAWRRCGGSGRRDPGTRWSGRSSAASARDRWRTHRHGEGRRACDPAADDVRRRRTRHGRCAALGEHTPRRSARTRLTVTPGAVRRPARNTWWHPTAGR